MTKDSAKVPPLKDSKAPDAPEQNDDHGASAGEAIAKQKIKVLYVVAKREGFRRAGFVFGSDRTRFLAEGLTVEQVKQLKAEPMLVVTEATEEI